MAFINSLLSYLLLFVISVGIAVCGFFAGKKLRNKKDAKTENEKNLQEQQKQ